MFLLLLTSETPQKLLLMSPGQKQDMNNHVKLEFKQLVRYIQRLPASTFSGAPLISCSGFPLQCLMLAIIVIHSVSFRLGHQRLPASTFCSHQHQLPP